MSLSQHNTRDPSNNLRLGGCDSRLARPERTHGAEADKEGKESSERRHLDNKNSTQRNGGMKVVV